MENLPKERHNIILLGASGVGKTSLSLKFIYDEFKEEYQPSKTEAYRKNIIVNGKSCQIDILDTANQESRAIQDQYLRSADGFLIIFSISCLESFEQMIEFREDVLRICDTDNEMRPFIILGNKVDCDANPKSSTEISTENSQLSDPISHGSSSFNSSNDGRAIPIEQIKALCDSWKIEYLETSAKNGKNVDKAFYHLIKKIQSFKLAEQTGMHRLLDSEITRGHGHHHDNTGFTILQNNECSLSDEINPHSFQKLGQGQRITHINSQSIDGNLCYTECSSTNVNLNKSSNCGTSTTTTYFGHQNLSKKNSRSKILDDDNSNNHDSGKMANKYHSNGCFSRARRSSKQSDTHATAKSHECQIGPFAVFKSFSRTLSGKHRRSKTVTERTKTKDNTETESYQLPNFELGKVYGKLGSKLHSS